MAVGGGVCVASPSSSSSSSVEAAWGRRTTSGVRRKSAVASATSVRCSIMGEAGPGASRGRGQEGLPPPCAHVPSRRSQGERDDGDSSVQFQRINLAYQMLMSNMRAADERLEYWRLKCGLTDEDLDRYRHHLNHEDGDDDWFDM